MIDRGLGDQDIGEAFCCLAHATFSAKPRVQHGDGNAAFKPCPAKAVFVDFKLLDLNRSYFPESRKFEKLGGSTVFAQQKRL